MTDNSRKKVSPKVLKSHLTHNYKDEWPTWKYRVQIKVTKDEIQIRTPDVVPEIRVDEPTTLGGGPSVSEGTSSGMSRDIQ